MVFRTFFCAAVTLVLASSQVHTADRYLNIHSSAEPETIDPNLAHGSPEHRVLTSLFEGLTTYHPKDMTPVPGVAEKWTVSADGKTYSYFLRKNALWSDGTPITAQDFIYSYERILNPKTGAYFATQLFPIQNAEAYNKGKVSNFGQVGVKAPDPYTLVIQLENPTPYMPYLSSHYPYFPVPRQVIEKHGAQWTRPENIVGNGPFVLEKWVPQKTFTVRKNPRYWDAANVKALGIHFLPVESQETALKMFDSGQLDQDWYLPVLMAPQLKESRPEYRFAPTLISYYYWLNTQHPQLKNPKIRRALALAIDRKAISDQFLKKMHNPSGTFVPANTPGYTSPTGIEFNPTEAKRLLAEAGITDPASIQLDILYNTQDMHKTIAEVIQQMWRQNLGITTTLHNQEWKSYIKDMTQKNFVVCRGSWIADYPDAIGFLELLISDSSQNYSHWGNPRFDALLEKAKREPNAAARTQILQQAERIVLDEVPLIPILQQNKDFMISPALKGYYANSLDIHPWKFVFLEGIATPSPWHQVRRHLGKEKT